MIRVTSPLSKRSKAWRRVGGGIRTWRVVRRARTWGGRLWRGFEGGSDC